MQEPRFLNNEICSALKLVVSFQTQFFTYYMAVFDPKMSSRAHKTVKIAWRGSYEVKVTHAAHNILLTHPAPIWRTSALAGPWRCRHPSFPAPPPASSHFCPPPPHPPYCCCHSPCRLSVGLTRGWTPASPSLAPEPSRAWHGFWCLSLKPCRPLAVVVTNKEGGIVWTEDELDVHLVEGHYFSPCLITIAQSLQLSPQWLHWHHDIHLQKSIKIALMIISLGFVTRLKCSL